MKKNVGKTDGWLRLGGAVVLILLAWTHVLTGAFAIAAFVVAIVLVMTASTGICPLYSLLGINTCKVEGQKG